MRKYKTGRLAYNPETDRYGLLIMDLWENSGFHCGDPVEVKVNGKWVSTRFENNKGQWYLPDTPFSDDLNYIVARIAA